MSSPLPRAPHGERKPEPAAPFLICRVRGRLCGLPLHAVVETMRPLPVEPVAGAPQLLLGLAMIRGAPTPVVDAGSVLGEPGSSPERFVTLRTRDRRVALAVEAVLGVATIPAASLSALPPLAGAASREAVSAIGASDAGLLFVLESARLVPEAVWVALAGRGASP